MLKNSLAIYHVLKELVYPHFQVEKLKDSSETRIEPPLQPKSPLDFGLCHGAGPLNPNNRIIEYE